MVAEPCFVPIVFSRVVISFLPFLAASCHPDPIFPFSGEMIEEEEDEEDDTASAADFEKEQMEKLEQEKAQLMNNKTMLSEVCHAYSMDLRVDNLKSKTLYFCFQPSMRKNTYRFHSMASQIIVKV